MIVSNDTIKLKPPYTLTTFILKRIASISEKIGEIRTAHLHQLPTELRKRNRIKTIQSSLEIEGNTLSIEQITALLDNKRVIAPEKDIKEVQNAISAYDKLDNYKAYSVPSLCNAHKILMRDLVEKPGTLRTTDVGIVKGSQVTHIAPPPNLVKSLLNNLFDYVQNDPELLLIKSCVFHYEFEFIHPFTDGNGRMGRLWQTVILRRQYPVFDYLPMESLIKKKQGEYYGALSQSDKEGNSTIFIEFMLFIIEESLEELLTTQRVSLNPKNRIEIFKTETLYTTFSRQDYMRHFKDISTATGSRDLKQAVIEGIIKKNGDKRMTEYQFV